MKYDLNFSTLIIFIIIGSLIYIKKFKKIFDTDYFIFISCFVYIFYVIKFAFFPIPIGEDYINLLKEINNSYGAFSYSNNFNLNINFYELTNIYNFIFLMPATLYLWYYNKKNIILKLFLLSLMIEVSQVVISIIINYPYKIFDINDILLNTSGGIFVYLIILFILKIYNILVNHSKVKINFVNEKN